MVYGSVYGAARMGVSEASFNPDYATPDAPFRMVTESIDTDQKFFDLMIEHDFLECAAGTNVELESALMAVDESFLSDAWEKIVEFIKKIRDKVVSILKAASVKIGAFFTRDNKALVEKYQKQFNNADLSKIEIKNFCEMEKDPVALIQYFEPDKYFQNLLGLSDKKAIEKFKKDHTVEKIIRETIKGYTGGSIKPTDTNIFKAARDVKANTIATAVTNALTNHQDTIKKIDEFKNKADETLKGMQEQAEKQKEYANSDAKEFEGQDGKGAEKRQVEQSKASAASSYCSVIQSCIGKLSGLAMDCIKFNIKQCRAAYIKIASKGAPNVHESAELLEAMIDADAYEVDSFFEQYSYDYEELTA